MHPVLPPLRIGPWKLSDLSDIPSHGKTVFSCFHCGGGSTMGYKLAGYNVLGGVEIDPEMMAIYRANHKPRHSYLMGVQEFIRIPNTTLPPELFNLDVLDGSPPCSSFSMAGSREKAWGEKKKFREGQADQVLDDLFFDFIAIAKKLQPKIVIAENVKGLIQGNARGYVKQIFHGFKDAGYECQLFLLNAACMGVPQARERTFFIARRNDLGRPPLLLGFHEPLCCVKDVLSGISSTGARLASSSLIGHWKNAGTNGRSKGQTGNTFGYFYRVNPGRPSATIQAGGAYGHWLEQRYISDALIKRIQTFPDDFNFVSSETQYVCGMSVPPFMMQRLASQLYKQLLC